MTNGEWVRGGDLDATRYHLTQGCPPYTDNCRAPNCRECWRKWESEEFVPLEKMSPDRQMVWWLRHFLSQVTETLGDYFCSERDEGKALTILTMLLTETKKEMVRIRDKKFKAGKGENIDK